MSEQVSSPESTTQRGSSHTSRPLDLTRTVGDADGLEGWMRFGGVVMTIVGGFGVIQGLVALLDPTTYIAVNGTVLSIDVSVWGWVHLVLGALLVVTGVSLLREAPSWARASGAVLVALSVLVQMGWMPAYPIWSILVIVLDVIVLFALVATSGDR